MSFVTRRSSILFFVGLFTILTARVVFRLLVDSWPLIDFTMVMSAIIAAGMVAITVEFGAQRRGK